MKTKCENFLYGEVNGKSKVDALLARLNELIESSSDIADELSKIVERIEKDNYINVPDIVRRWVPSQCLAMLESKCGFHALLVSRGWKYSWRVLLDDLKWQANAYKKRDFYGYTDRSRWYNGKVAKSMANHFVHEYTLAFNLLLNNKTKKAKLPNGMVVTKDEFDSQLIPHLDKLVNKIYDAGDNPILLYKEVLSFYNYAVTLKVKPKKPCDAFLNAFKAAGAYYTMKDLIMFSGFMYMNKHSRSPYYGEDAVSELDENISSILKGQDVQNTGYALLGHLKEFLEYNKYEYEEVKRGWSKKHEDRRIERENARMNRRSRV